MSGIAKGVGSIERGRGVVRVSRLLVVVVVVGELNVKCNGGELNVK